MKDDRNWGVRDAERDVKRTTPFGRVPILVSTPFILPLSTYSYR